MSAGITHSKTKPIVRPETLPSLVWEVDTPDGTMYVTISELDGVPFEVDIRVGKAGLPLRAWCDATANLINALIQRSIPLTIVIQAVSNLSSHRISNLPNGSKIRSGPEGIAYCLMSYVRRKAEKRQERGSASMEFGDLGE